MPAPVQHGGGGACEALLEVIETLRLMRQAHARMRLLQADARGCEPTRHNTQLAPHARTHPAIHPCQSLQTRNPVRCDELRGSRWCRRARISREIGNGEVDLMADPGDHRNRRTREWPAPPAHR